MATNKTAQRRGAELPLERPVKVFKVPRLTHVHVRLQQAHDDRHGRLVAAEAAQPRNPHDLQVQLGGLA